MSYRVDVTYSPDDGGYYAEVIDERGHTVYTTDVHNTVSAASEQAQNWIDAHGDDKQES